MVGIDIHMVHDLLYFFSLLKVSFIHICQDYFTSTRAILLVLCTHDVTLKNMGEYLT